MDYFTLLQKHHASYRAAGVTTVKSQGWLFSTLNDVPHLGTLASVRTLPLTSDSGNEHIKFLALNLMVSFLAELGNKYLDY